MLPVHSGCLGDDDDIDLGGASGDARTEELTDEGIELTHVVEGLQHPWSLAFVPSEPWLLVTEREGRLNILDRESGNFAEVGGVPDVHAVGQGGLLDVGVHPRYPDERWVYLTYAASDDHGDSTTMLGRGVLTEDANELQEFEVLYTAAPYVDSTSHYGSRVVFDEDDRLYMTIGDRGFKDFGPDHVSQNTGNDLGTTIRLETDGAVPADNPLTDNEDTNHAIYSYGHRNTQGMTVHPQTGEIWQSEHGEEDGDAINVLEAGGNYGWPIAHYGCEYGTDQPIGDEPRDVDAVVDPVYWWECGTGGFPPAGMAFYDGDAFPDWENDLFVGNLAGAYLGRFDVDGRDVAEVDPLLDDRGWRIRDVAVAPDTGFVWVAIDDSSAPLVRLSPTYS